MAGEVRELRDATAGASRPGAAWPSRPRSSAGRQGAPEPADGDRATLTLTNASRRTSARDWLAEARSAARARPLEANLTRGPGGYSGTLVAQLGRHTDGTALARAGSAAERGGTPLRAHPSAFPNPRWPSWPGSARAMRRTLGRLGRGGRRAGRRWCCSPRPRWLASRCRGATDQRLLLTDARGTVWNGSALPVLTGGAGSRDAAALPGRLHWQTRPGAASAAELRLRQACCLRGEVRVQVRPRPRTAVRSAAAGRSSRHRRPMAGRLARRPGHAAGTRMQLGGMLRLTSPGLTLESVQGRGA